MQDDHQSADGRQRRREVIITESGNYDTFVVSKSVTVAAEPGVSAGIVSSIAAAIVINAAQPIDTVTIRNLSLKNILVPNSNTEGIYNANGTNLYIDDCTFTGFGDAVDDGEKPGKLFVHNSVFRNNYFALGMDAPASGLVNVVVEHCKFEHNEIGIYINSRNYAVIRDSVLADNHSYGITVTSTLSGQRAEAVIDKCQLSGGINGLAVIGNPGISAARVSNSTITQNTANGVILSGMATAYTFQNNVINGNLTDISGALTTVTLK